MASPETTRVYNFSAGPAVLPEPVLLEAQRDLFSYPGAGMSVLEMSHRGKHYDAIHQAAKDNLKKLMGVPDNYRILFLQGGASLQFSMVPMNFLPADGTADYIVTGSWSKKAVKEAKRVGKVNIAATCEETNFDRLPTAISLTPGAAYVHFTSNETIHGVEWPTEPDSGGAPLVCDMSSDILSRPVDVSKYGLIYAGAQKNMGPAGVTVVIIREDLLEKVPEGLHSMLDYKLQAENDSLYNTPPCFAIYIVGLVVKYVQAEGGLQAMFERNRRKASVLYKVIDESGGFYRGHAQPDCRSLMNVTFRMATEDLEKQFITEAAAAGFAGLKGHRSVGGLRASIYNAFPAKGCDDLAQFMVDFQRKS
ncbi:MAG: 3-phosphoserine/phosphohydroxythreonine transaminase [Fimbriimonadia bacterium]|jgi:phosphoserine aminotransferase